MKIILVLLCCVSAALAACGTTQHPAVTRIVGGSKAKRGSWPWQISLQYGGRHICGGSLISADWIVTAAHCVMHQSNAAYYKVRVGEHYFNKVHGTDIQASQIITHPDWKGVTGSIVGDVALIKLSQSVQLGSEWVNSVCVASPAMGGDYFVGNGDCWVTGWGYINGIWNTKPTELMQVNGPAISNVDCNRKWGSGRIKDSQICFAYGNDSISACRGDSGGPFVCKVAGAYQMIGIVSWGNSQCRSYPTVFSRVSHYHDWMKSTMALY